MRIKLNSSASSTPLGLNLFVVQKVQSLPARTVPAGAQSPLLPVLADQKVELGWEEGPQSSRLVTHDLSKQWYWEGTMCSNT